MIENGLLRHGLRESVLSTLQFNKPVLHAVVSATLTTIISYQAAVILTDVCLGLKKLGKTRVSDISTLLITQESSLLAVAAAVFDTEYLRRLRYRSNLHDTARHEQSDWFTLPKSLSLYRRVLPKMLLLLLGIPIINIISIVVLLERDTDITFSESNFGGVALGMRTEDNGLEVFMSSLACIGFKTDFGHGIKRDANFAVCSYPYLTEYNLNSTTIQVDVTAQRSSFTVNLTSPGRGYSFINYIGNLRVNEEIPKIYRIPHQLGPSEFQQLAMNSALVLRDLCDSRSKEPLTPSNIDMTEGDIQKAQFYVDCPTFSHETFTNLTQTIQTRFVLVEVPEMQVASIKADEGREIAKEEFHSGNDLLLMTRRRPLASLDALFIATTVLIILRVIVKTLTRNDIHVAIELLMKKAVGMDWSSPMMRTDEFVEYCAGKVDELFAEEIGMKYVTRLNSSSDASESSKNADSTKGSSNRSDSTDLSGSKESMDGSES